MKIALIFPNNLFRAPYLDYYTKILTQQGVDFTIYNWDREGKAEENCISFTSSNDSRTPLKILLDFYKFRKFITTQIDNQKYDKVIVFSAQISILLSGFLRRNFKRNYLVDIRDYTKVISFLTKRFNKTLVNASYVCISSQGFKEWLPKNIDYIISHNINSSLLSTSIPAKSFFKNNRIHVDTIGALRDHISNSKVIQSLKNHPKFFMTFIGDGYALPILKDLAAKENVKNIDFYGYYKKKDEFELLQSSDYINIMVGNDFLSKGLTSNRLYLCALYQIPAIVNSNTEQSRIIDKFKFGIVVNHIDDLPKQLLEYKKQFNEDTFRNNCDYFLKEVKKEMKSFENCVITFIQN